jgi:hypothetical protein
MYLLICIDDNLGMGVSTLPHPQIVYWLVVYYNFPYYTCFTIAYFYKIHTRLNVLQTNGIVYYISGCYLFHRYIKDKIFAKGCIAG